MRDDLRRTADAVWVIDCSPEGHQPDVPSRIFQGVQQPVCIVLVSRSKAKAADTPAAVAAHPGYTARFLPNLTQPGPRIPLTADGRLFAEAVELGRAVVRLHTFGERYADPKAGRPGGPPRLPKDRAPTVPKEGTIPGDPDAMPDDINYELVRRRLRVGTGFIDHVPPAVWDYEVSGKRVLTQWFSDRKRDPERPVIGDRRKPSALGDIRPEG